MERGMKSDTTEMVLLGAAAAVIALVVAFSMMGDKGNKRSLDDPDDDPVETARDVRQKVEGVKQKVENDVAELEIAAKRIQAETSKAEKIVSELKPLVPAGGKADKVLTTAESIIGTAKAGGNALRNILGDDKVDDLKEAAGNKVKEAGKKFGGWALGKLKERFT
jgi:hypothetical protein